MMSIIIDPCFGNQYCKRAKSYLAEDTKDIEILEWVISHYFAYFRLAG